MTETPRQRPWRAIATALNTALWIVGAAVVYFAVGSVEAPKISAVAMLFLGIGFVLLFLGRVLVAQAQADAGETEQ